jgi:hypothetical protein
MASILEAFTDRDVATLAGISGCSSADELRANVRLRPWALHELLEDEDVFDAVMARHDHPANVVSPSLLFGVLAHRVARELRTSTFVHDWAGPRSRLPVFDVEPLHEFVADPGRLSFLIRLLASFVVPEPPPVPANPMDMIDLAGWVEAALPEDRVTLLRRLGDLALFLAGVFPDRVGSAPLMPVDAQRLGKTLDMTSDDVLALCSITSLAPGLDAFDTLGAAWYSAAREAAPTQPAVVSDIASRFSSARRVLNVLSDRYLNHIEPGFAAA